MPGNLLVLNDSVRPSTERADHSQLWEAAKARVGRRPSGSQVRALLARATDATEVVSAETAIYVLSFSSLSKRRLHEVVLRLLDAVDDFTRPPSVRGFAAEGVGNLLARTKQATLRRHAILRLVTNLDDPAPEVRFWTAFTLGVLRARQARSALATLVSDTAVVPGWWSVGDEAADALDTIAARQPPDRLPTRPAESTRT